MDRVERTCVDRGGTFTDVVTIEPDGTVTLRKVRSDQAVVGSLARGSLTFGTTVATNALLERTGVRTLLLVTEGLADLVQIGDMTRPALFSPEVVRPPPLCDRVLEVAGRIDATGRPIEPLRLPTSPSLDDVDAVAVVLLNSCRNPDHEVQVARWLADLRPDLHVCMGHRASPELGYLARIDTTLVDAAITPVLRASLQRDAIPDGALAVRSDGSLVPAEQLRAPDAVLSGPAGGVVAVAAVARQAGLQRAVGFDMGGTSTDVCLVHVDALPRRDGDVEVAGVRLRRPMLEVDTIAAGGGSVVWHDGRRIGVGPRSAGAHPGPQCYGRGGPPTLTDAALQAGLLDPAAFDPPLSADAVALPEGGAEAYLDVARDAMAAAIQRLATRRGLDVREHALVAFGGAAGQHAAGVADRLGITRVLVHPCASVLSAWGQALARREEASVVPIWAPLEDPDTWPRVEAAWRSQLQALPELGEHRCSVDVRHVGADASIEIDASDPQAVRDAFARAHRARYGFDRDQPLSVVNARVRAQAPRSEAPVVPADPWGIEDRTVHGPRRLDAPTTSVWVPAGWHAQVRSGLLQLHRTEPAPTPLPTERTPHAVALWASRFMVVATEAGTVLERTARSVNIRERHDFSCAVFDGEGRLVANAPHIPVHLGAMGATVRDLIRRVPELQPDQHYLTNDPAAGGSHLPDLTVVHPVVVEGQRFFVACRGHHVDVGGTTPGSMPPRSRALREEGFVVRALPLLDEGRLRTDLGTHLRGCRQLDVVAADLEAQIAANTCAARALVQLGPADVVARWMAHLQDVAAEAALEALHALPTRVHATDAVGGVPLQVRVHRDGTTWVVDFAGTGAAHTGNLNAPRAVVRAAVLYALRVLAARDIPLNEGALRHVQIEVPAGSILDPPPGAAVAGGNVETSQRVVDLLLRAAGHMASSAGTMSNLTLGGDGWSLYETIGGGQGASPRGPGPSGRQIHMTNTKATDPEVLEARLPVRVRRFALRTGSGGEGKHPGGDGIVRELEVTSEARAALLATRRTEGAAGLGSGGSGIAGRDEIVRGGHRQPWSGEVVALAPGDRVCVATPGGGGWSPAGRIEVSSEDA